MGRFGDWRGRRALAAIMESGLLAADFPRRAHFTHVQWARMTDEQKLESRSPEKDAHTAIAGQSTLLGHLERLARERYEPAVPTLILLWNDCPLSAIRHAAGEALLAIGTPAARAALESMLDDADYFPNDNDLAIRAVFAADPSRAFDRFAPYFDRDCVEAPGGATIPERVLWAFCPMAWVPRVGPQWNDPRAREWFASDPRWTELCVQLRRHHILGDAARNTLEHADQELVSATARRVLQDERRKTKTPRSQPDGDLLNRYCRGDHVGVWDAIRSADGIAGDFREEVLAVARETMRRVAINADLVAKRLGSRGWKALHGSLRTIPEPSHQKWMKEAEDATGASLPPTLKAFWEDVGGVDLVWNYELDEAPSLGVDLAMDEMDPLLVYPPSIVEELREEWDYERGRQNREIAGPFRLDLAPDYLHKANISGGGPYHMELPFFGADPILEGESHRLPFVEYLRMSFRWGGFPRLESHSDRADVQDFLKWISEGLEPF